MPVFYSPNGNPEIWENKPDGYLTVEEWEKKHPVEEMSPQDALIQAKNSKLQQINSEIEAAILAGFDYEINGQVLHFSYQYNDQQNFADSNNVAMLGKMGVQGVPDAVTWNGWKVERDEDGKELSRSLVKVQLTSNEFITFYTQGALAHKARQMDIGTQRKTKVEEATTIEELEVI